MQKQKKKITIIGAGPIGSYTAYKLSKEGEEVEVYEEHENIGEPMQCAGIITSEINSIIKLNKNVIINKPTHIKIKSPNNELKLETTDIIIDRTRFDQWLARKAKKQGAKYHLGHRYLGKKGKTLYFETKKGLKKVKTDITIGADGPLSKTAKTHGMQKKEYYIGIQARIKGRFNPKTYEVYLGSMCPGFFAWIIPEDKKTARVGLAAKKYSSKLLEEFLKEKKYTKIIDKQAGLIPIYNGKKAQKKHIYLIGDAAGQVKATTGGGIIPSLKAADILTECIRNNKNYDKQLKPIKRQLFMHRKIRQILDKFTDKDYDKLLEMLKKEKVQEVLKETNRDKPIKLAKKLITKQPRLLRYMLKIL